MPGPHTAASIAWNPLDSDDDALEIAARLVAVLKMLGLQAQDSFFLDAARTVIGHAISLLRASTTEGPPALHEIRQLVSDAGLGEHGDFYDRRCGLTHLATEKLAVVADMVRAEGWKWVEVCMQQDYGLTADMRRVYPEPAPRSEADQAKLDALEAELEAIMEGDGTTATQAEIADMEFRIPGAEVPAIGAPVSNRHAAGWTWRGGLVAQQRSASRQARRTARAFDDRELGRGRSIERRPLGAGPDRSRARGKTFGAVSIEPDG